MHTCIIMYTTPMITLKVLKQHSQPGVDDGESQGTPDILVHVLHRL